MIDYEPWYTLDPAACGNYVTGLALKLLEDSLADTQAKKEVRGLRTARCGNDATAMRASQSLQASAVPYLQP